MEQKKIGCGLRKQRKGGVNKLNEKWEEELLEENPPYELEKLDKENILEDKIFDYLIALPNSPSKTRIIEKLRSRAKELKVIRAVLLLAF